MYCCSNCFSDRFLKSYISTSSQEIGLCSICNTHDTQILESKLLIDKFIPLLSLYDKCPPESGRFLYEHLQNDWGIFSDKVHIEKRKELLIDIFGDTIPVDEMYAHKIERGKDRIEQWEEFEEELKHINRFFPTAVLDKESLGFVFGLLSLPDTEKPKVLYRARINHKNHRFELNEMGKPSNESVSNGRANPIGISYLYAASDERTAIYEARPYKGEIVTVVKINIIKNIGIADLRNPLHTISPFELEEENLLSAHK